MGTQAPSVTDDASRSVQSMYRDYRDGKLIVNRRYQRKLVWTIEEKQKLIDSILHDYPIPLLLLAELRSTADHRAEHLGKQRKSIW